ncbi:MAG: universal stress protein, partial [Chloroflexota bacterium]|nr:universal stress protein [Chloroflexota bacterium]
HDFQTARQRASIQEVLARITGKPTELLSYEEVAEKLKLHIRSEGGVQQIPLDAIVGSVGRYTDFTRTFLPRRAEDRDRWVGVRAAFLEGGAGLPPIEVYKVGDVYFVIDGNHRVSIARQEKFTTIEAHVIEVRTQVSLTPDIRAEDLIIKSEYADFLETTRIVDLRPNVDLSVTVPGQYHKLLEEICARECQLEINTRSSIPFDVAVADWYDNIYIPLAEAVRDRGLLRWFPDRTITDLYLWISENRSILEKELGWEIESDIAATGLILERSAQSEPGSWRKARTSTRYTDHLFTDILIPLSGREGSWAALDQAIAIAQRENARLHGLHIVDSKEKIQSPGPLAIQAQFSQHCKAADVNGNLVIEAGDIARKIRERAAMTDLIVLKIEHPPTGGLSTITSPFRTIIVNSSSPVLGIPDRATHFKRALLSFDGSPTAKEALFVAAYFAEMWQTELVVFTALDGSKVKADVQDYVRRYLEIHEVEAEFILSEHGAMDYLNQTVEERDIDLVLMGSYGISMLRQVLTGSAVDYMLRESKVPMLICH